jgi:Prephenate dehydrogenase
MWRDIFLNNREAMLEILQRFNEDLTALQRAIRWGEGDKLQELFTRTRAIRRSIIEAKQARFGGREGRTGTRRAVAHGSSPAGAVRGCQKSLIRRIIIPAIPYPNRKPGEDRLAPDRPLVSILRLHKRYRIIGYYGKPGQSVAKSSPGR